MSLATFAERRPLRNPDRPHFTPSHSYPSIDEAEKLIPGPPPKGKPKPDPNGPARFKKDLATYINSLTFEHACVVIACSSTPEEADPKSIADCFDRVVFVPCPDYATRLAIWRRELQAVFAVVSTELPEDTARRLKREQRQAAVAGAGGAEAAPPAPVVEPSPWSSVPSNIAPPSEEALAASGAAAMPLSIGFGPLPLSMAAVFSDSEEQHPMLRGLNFSALATVSNGYSAGSIRAAVRTALSLRRLDRLDVLPLTESELVNSLARQPRLYRDEAERLADFSAKSTGLESARVVVEDAGGPKKK